MNETKKQDKPVRPPQAPLTQPKVTLEQEAGFPPDSKESLLEEIGNLNVELNNENEQIAFHHTQIENHTSTLNNLKEEREKKMKALRKLLGELL